MYSGTSLWFRCSTDGQQSTMQRVVVRDGAYQGGGAATDWCAGRLMRVGSWRGKGRAATDRWAQRDVRHRRRADPEEARAAVHSPKRRRYVGKVPSVLCDRLPFPILRKIVQTCPHVAIYIVTRILYRRRMALR